MQSINVSTEYCVELFKEMKNNNETSGKDWSVAAKINLRG